MPVLQSPYAKQDPRLGPTASLLEPILLEGHSDETVSPAPAAAAAYEKALREHFGDGVGPAFDLNILGIGEDGHTASVS